jgi:hypothetical protein
MNQNIADPTADRPRPRSASGLAGGPANMFLFEFWIFFRQTEYFQAPLHTYLDPQSIDDGQSVATGNSADAFYLQSWILADFACYEFVWAKTGLDLTILESRKKH